MNAEAVQSIVDLFSFCNWTVYNHVVFLCYALAELDAFLRQCGLDSVAFDNRHCNMVAKIYVFDQAGYKKAVRFWWTKGSNDDIVRIEFPYIGEVVGEERSPVIGSGATVALVFPTGDEQSFMVVSILTNDRNHQDPLLLLNHLDKEEKRLSEYKYVVLFRGFSISPLERVRHHYIHWYIGEGNEQISDTMYGNKSQHCFKADRSIVFDFTGVMNATAGSASSSSSMPIAEWEADLDIQEAIYAASRCGDSLELAQLQVAIVAASADVCCIDQPVCK